MIIVVLVIVVLCIVFAPQWWASRTFKKYSYEQPSMRGTGGELAKHLVESIGITGVIVEETPQGDHYDPSDKAVRLSPSNFKGKSLTAIAVAAHEVGHAIQDHENSSLLANRTRLVRFAMVTDKIGSIAIIGMPVVALLTRIPAAAGLMIALALGSMLVGTVVHLVTLPVELDASFKKALPILKNGNYINPEDEPAVNQILKAAAYTYVAASLASILNLARWFAILRR
jgi:hypothetical protein